MAKRAKEVVVPTLNSSFGAMNWHPSGVGVAMAEPIRALDRIAAITLEEIAFTSERLIRTDAAIKIDRDRTVVP